MSLNEHAAKLDAGKFSFRAAFKSDAEKKQTSINKKAMVQDLEKDVANLDVIRKYLIIYFATFAIPSYKKARVEAYVRAMGCMTYVEIQNAQSIMECFQRF